VCVWLRIIEDEEDDDADDDDDDGNWPRYPYTHVRDLHRQGHSPRVLTVRGAESQPPPPQRPQPPPSDAVPHYIIIIIIHLYTIYHNITIVVITIVGTLYKCVYNIVYSAFMYTYIQEA